ncbi:2-dehydropantoate 2-reductase [Venustampulla echinocandica]|uniref:2-dehydropantoate 2-reductase n=1 Tax=Venustampulla echinocandica TaxID=2656787 RepID=A0A370TR98_9HELO|nr:2-dehydropantoate 2-reductase [Venustampulla echinocandica]RDL38050.1 2-dehydropantoate 2-reductase [Venustampulla echinocandica]
MSKSTVLLIGSGAVGTMAAYNLEAVLKTIPKVEEEGLSPFDYILVATKNTPDIPPTVADLVASAVTPGHTAILLLQNGLNIEKPLIQAFPNNPILSGVSLISATETKPGSILHDAPDDLIVGAFTNPSIPQGTSISSAERFVEMYSASGKVKCTYDADVGAVRWRKLIYNSSYNSICAITGMDTSRLRIAEHPIEEVIRPLMREIWTIARKAGHEIPEEVIQKMIDIDPLETYFKPSMLQDIEKGNYIELENIVGEPMREAERLGVPAPGLKMAYGLLRIMQWKTKERRGLVVLPSKEI